jgi:TetR/AcrR family transcriptional repressor of uid operon
LSRESAAPQRIIAAARYLFARRGFHQTAMADLAREADVSVGSIYRSYASKADIILALILADSEEMLVVLQDDAAQVHSGAITLEAAIERIILRRLREKDEALTHEILAEALRNPAVGSAIGDFGARYRVLFRDLVHHGCPALAGAELDGAAELLMGCLFGLGHRELARSPLDQTTTARIVARQIMGGLRG